MFIKLRLKFVWKEEKKKKEKLINSIIKNYVKFGMTLQKMRNKMPIGKQKPGVIIHRCKHLLDNIHQNIIAKIFSFFFVIFPNFKCDEKYGICLLSLQFAEPHPVLSSILKITCKPTHTIINFYLSRFSFEKNFRALCAMFHTALEV